MLKKIIALAASTAMLGANAAAQALNSVRTVAKNMIGVAGEEPKPGDGRNILPSIPPMAPEEKARPATHKSTGTKAVAPKASKAKSAGHGARANTRGGASRRKSRSRSSK